MEIREIFTNVFKVDSKLATKSIVKGMKVYDEELIKVGEVEYRLWNPYRSKLAAAIINGLGEMQIKPGSKILYLGAATGTTSSHVSDIVEQKGDVYCIEISERNMRQLLKVCEKRTNMLPLLSDARMVDNYAEEVGEVDVIYQDVSARDQADILVRNSRLLKKGGIAYVAIKSQSISSSRDPNEVFKEFLNDVSGTFVVLERIDIRPFDKDHLFVSLRKR